jgi:ferric-dicitrate binding protein FerR (iron transport regulator)
MQPKPYNTHIQELAEKWLNGTITPDEEKEFATWYNQFDDGAELLVEQDFAKDGPALKERIYSVLQSKLEAGIETEAPAVVPTVHRIQFLRRNWLKGVAAAIVGVGLTMAIYLFRTHRTTNLSPQANVATVKNDLPPGGSKAVLILANGANVVLDSAAKGKIADQGNGQVTKLANGQIVYSSNNASSGQVFFNSLITPRGGQYKLGLPDGTEVWLNSASSIKYPTAFAGKERVVEITGEAYFEVAKNKSMPFKVKMGQAQVEVLGTHFNINAYPDEGNVKTTLLEGSVKVEQLTSHHTQTIQPGQQAQLQDDATIIVASNVDLVKVMAWKNGFFEFDNTSLPVIMRQISRWYDVDVILGENISYEKFGGRISKELPLSQILKLLEANNIKYQLEGRKLTIE